MNEVKFDKCPNCLVDRTFVKDFMICNDPDGIPYQEEEMWVCSECGAWGGLVVKEDK